MTALNHQPPVATAARFPWSKWSLVADLIVIVSVAVMIDAGGRVLILLDAENVIPGSVLDSEVVV